MFLQIIPRLHQYCQEHSSFNELADKLNWPRAELADFFAGKDTTLHAVHQVAMAMGLTLDIQVTPKDDVLETQPNPGE